MRDVTPARSIAKIEGKNMKRSICKYALVTLMIMSCGNHALAMGRGKPTDTPTGPLPAECVAVESQSIGSLARDQIEHYEARWVNDICFAWGINEPPHCPEPRGHWQCQKTSTTLTIQDGELENVAHKFANEKGYISSPDHLIQYQVAPWTLAQPGGTPSLCRDQILRQEISVSVSLDGPDLKKARCLKLDQCISKMTNEASVLLVRQWQNQFGCN
jgi:hypothetical protein